MARLGGLYARLTDRPVLLAPKTVATLHVDERVDSGKGKRDLGATFRPLEETLRDEVVWFVANGYTDETAGSIGPASDRSELTRAQ